MMSNTGENPVPNVWIGDFPPSSIKVHPYQPTITSSQIVPNTLHTLPDFWGGITIGPTTNPRKLDVKHDCIIATIDVPGCKAEGIELELLNGRLSVKAHRNKGGYSSFDTVIGVDYDPMTAEVEVADGVLTVTVMRFKDKVPYRIPVKKKWRRGPSPARAGV